MPSQSHSTHTMTDHVRSCRKRLSASGSISPGGTLYPLLYHTLVSMERLAAEMDKHILRVSSGNYTPEQMASAFQPGVLERSQRILAALEQVHQTANDKHKGSVEGQTAVQDLVKCFKKLADRGIVDRDALQKALDDSYRRKCKGGTCRN